MPSIMMKLKQGTWPLHQQLEQSLDLLNPRFSAADYRRLIEAFWGYYRPLEAQLQAHQSLREWLPDLAQRAKWPLLETDLLVLGHAEVPPRLNVVELSSKVPSPHGNAVELSLPAYQLVGRQPLAAETSRGFSRHGDADLLLNSTALPPQLPVCGDLPVCNSIAQAFGCLYVLEGATLGGRVLCRHFNQTLGLDVHNGSAFFAGYGEATGAMWALFGERLTAANVDETAAIQSACQTFQTLEQWFRATILLSEDT